MGRLQKTFFRFATVIYLCAVAAETFVFFGGNLIIESLDIILLQRLIELIDQNLPYILCICLISDIAVNGLSAKKMMFGIVGGLVSQVAWHIHPDGALLNLFWLILAYPTGCSLRLVVRIFWTSGLSAVVLVVGLCWLGIRPDIVFYQHGALRHSMGFVSPNSLSTHTTCISIAFVFDKSKGWRWWYAPPIICLLVLVYYTSNGRYALILGVIYVSTVTAFCMLDREQLLRLRDRLATVVYLIARWAFPLCAIVCLMFTVVWAQGQLVQIYDFMNQLLSDRPTEMVSFFKQYGFQLFGQPIETVGLQQALETGNDWVGLDNAYINGFLRSGLLVIALIGFLYYLLGRYARQTSNLALAICIAVFSLYGLTENVLFYDLHNFVVYGIGAMLSDSVVKGRTNG